MAKSAAFAALLHRTSSFPGDFFLVFPLHSSLLAFFRGGIYFPSPLKEDPSDLVSGQTTEGSKQKISEFLGYFDNSFNT